MHFGSYHPAINFLFFGAVIASAALFNQPVFLAVGYGCAFFYAVLLNGRRGAVFNLLLLPAIALFALFYSCYHHFGVTRLAVNFIGNQITLEALATGTTLGVRAASVLMWLSCMNTVVSSDKVVYLFGRISPKLSLFLSILLRAVPWLKARARKVHTAQKAIGRGINQGSPFRRLCNFFRLASILVTWTMEDMIETSASMKCRGYTLKGRTAFSIYRFDYRDRSVVIAIFSCVTLLIMAALLDQTRILYNPELILNRITPLSFVFYAAYLLLCLLPAFLEIGSMKKGKEIKA